MNYKMFEAIVISVLLVSALVLVLLLLSSCTSPTGINYGSVTEFADGTVRTEQVSVSAPVSAKNDSYITSCTNGLRIAVSGVQSVADLAKAKGDARNKGLLYGGCALLLLVGGVALALPNQLVSNKDALMVLGAGGASIAVVMWVDESASVMKWVLPALIIGAVMYIGWTHYSKKSFESQTNKQSR